MLPRRNSDNVIGIHTSRIFTHVVELKSYRDSSDEEREENAVSHFGFPADLHHPVARTEFSAGPVPAFRYWVDRISIDIGRNFSNSVIELHVGPLEVGCFPSLSPGESGPEQSHGKLLSYYARCDMRVV
jgi:hypothetical protein